MKKIYLLIFVFLNFIFSFSQNIKLERYVKEDCILYNEIEEVFFVCKLKKNEKVIILKEFNQDYYSIKTKNNKTGIIAKNKLILLKEESKEYFKVKILKKSEIYLDNEAKEIFDYALEGEEYILSDLTEFKEGYLLKTKEDVYIYALKDDFDIIK